jgi:hypothetical protein
MAPERIKRRDTLKVGLGGLVTFGTLPLATVRTSTAIANTAPETVVYVSNAGSRDISVR